MQVVGDQHGAALGSNEVAQKLDGLPLKLLPLMTTNALKSAVAQPVPFPRMVNEALSPARSPTVISFDDLHDGPAAFGGRGSVFSRRAAERGVDGGPAANVRAPASCRRGRVQPERSEELPRSVT